MALIGFVAVVSYAYEAKTSNDDVVDDGKKEKKKKALLLPFDRMTIVERREDSASLQSNLRRLASSTSSSPEDDGKPIVIGIKDLVDLIHEAADDPRIVALYGTFGRGHRFDPGGYAKVEEVRDAIAAFNESRRRRRGNDDDDDGVVVEKREEKEEEEVSGRDKKASYAFADTFGHPLDSGNKEYYLASAFSHIHLQTQGELNLYGLAKTDLFLGGTMKKYGVKVHVFKHGKYKNAPNVFTETDYTRPHLDQTRSYLKSINDRIFRDIQTSRSSASLEKAISQVDEKTWEAVRKYGTMTCDNALELGLVDFAVDVDPLDELLRSNRKEKRKEKEEELEKESREEERKNDAGDDVREGDDDGDGDGEEERLDRDDFRAEETTSLSEYASVVAKRKRAERRTWERHEIVSKLAERSAATRTMFGFLGWTAPNYFVDEEEFRKREAPPHPSDREKIAIVHVSGTIDDDVARKTISSLKRIEKDDKIKCVVMRVNSPGGTVTASEAISEECKRLSKPIVCSMGDVAASGGYYVSARSDRIFVSPATLTGSVGVFGIRLDLTGFLRRYGATSRSVAIGPHSDGSDPLRPLDGAAERNLARNVDRRYRRFKEVVSDGREMSVEDVEDVAQGRVWTGEQAKRVGLADETGGLRRAVSYAKRAHCRPSDDEDDVDVEVWPKRGSLWERLSGAAAAATTTSGTSATAAAWDILRELLPLPAGGGEESFGPDASSSSSSSSDDAAVVATLVGGGILDVDRVVPRWTALGGGSKRSTLGGVFATMDETEALRLVLGGDGIGGDGTIRGRDYADDASSSAFPPSFWR